MYIYICTYIYNQQFITYRNLIIFTSQYFYFNTNIHTTDINLNGNPMTIKLTVIKRENLKFHFVGLPGSGVNPGLRRVSKGLSHPMSCYSEGLAYPEEQGPSSSYSGSCLLLFLEWSVLYLSRNSPLAYSGPELLVKINTKDKFLSSLSSLPPFLSFSFSF